MGSRDKKVYQPVTEYKVDEFRPAICRERKFPGSQTQDGEIENHGIYEGNSKDLVVSIRDDTSPMNPSSLEENPWRGRYVHVQCSSGQRQSGHSPCNRNDQWTRITRIRKVTTYLFCDHTAMLGSVRDYVRRSQSTDLRSYGKIDTREPDCGVSKHLVKRIQALAIDFRPDVEGNGTTRSVMIRCTRIEEKSISHSY